MRSDGPCIRCISLGTSRRFDLHCSIADDLGKSCLCRMLFIQTLLLFLFLNPHHDALSQIFAQNKAIAVILGLTLVVEVVVGGISISTTSPPPPSAAPAGLGPPCGAVMGPFGWLVAFWVGKTSGKSILWQSHLSSFYRQSRFSTILSYSCR